MKSKLLKPPRAHSIDPGVVPDVRPVSPMLPQLEIVDVRRVSVFPHKYQLVFGTIERAHSTVGLVPDRQVLELGVGAPASLQRLPQVPPIHTDEVNGAIDAVVDEEPKDSL